jgi:hypothetical protein
MGWQVGKGRVAAATVILQQRCGEHASRMPDATASHPDRSLNALYFNMLVLGGLSVFTFELGSLSTF